MVKSCRRGKGLNTEVWRMPCEASGIGVEGGLGNCICIIAWIRDEYYSHQLLSLSHLPPTKDIKPGWTTSYCLPGIDKSGVNWRLINMIRRRTCKLILAHSHSNEHPVLWGWLRQVDAGTLPLANRVAHWTLAYLFTIFLMLKGWDDGREWWRSPV